MVIRTFPRGAPRSITRLLSNLIRVVQAGVKKTGAGKEFSLDGRRLCLSHHKNARQFPRPSLIPSLQQTKKAAAPPFLPTGHWRPGP